MSDERQELKDERTLRRLETLVDSVFALVIVLFVLDFPECLPLGSRVYFQS